MADYRARLRLVNRSFRSRKVALAWARRWSKFYSCSAWVFDVDGSYIREVINGK